MLTGKTSVLIDTQKSDEDAPAAADDTNQTIDSSVMDDQTDDGENEADDNCKNKRDRPKQGGVMKAVDRSKFGKFIIHYGKTFFLPISNSQNKRHQDRKKDIVFLLK